jgi:8-oxo-dGTP pyrophosphatase MutT (NUDIX family)
MTWKPNLTVAAIIEQDGKFLMVEELSSDGIAVINQPAGHVELGETITHAVIRETLEETAYDFLPDSLVGAYYWYSKAINFTCLRFTFTGQLIGHHPERSLDKGIVRTLWYSKEQLYAEAYRHRSPIVSRCMEDYLKGKRYPLEFINTIFPD